MKYLKNIIKYIWWLSIGYIPIAISSLTSRYREYIGCPEKGDCYIEGSMLLIHFDLTTIFTAFILWPVCLWYLGVNKLVIFIWSHITKRSSRV